MDLFTSPLLERRCLYLDALKDTRTPWEMNLVIEMFRASLSIRPWKDIPV
ncbi:hypothetical protein HUA76_07380 [Myxococcus sp. CA056]|nr:hypothetical protein [Myxococcus sp. CA056]NTX10603.1 hypothetical protein [Myxococcus sp. CA056]